MCLYVLAGNLAMARPAECHLDRKLLLSVLLYRCLQNMVIAVAITDGLPSNRSGAAHQVSMVDVRRKNLFPLLVWQLRPHPFAKPHFCLSLRYITRLRVSDALNFSGSPAAAPYIHAMPVTKSDTAPKQSYLCNLCNIPPRDTR